jgi:omega-6 fatty acid desaturase (delta-12 desaturase)
MWWKKLFFASRREIGSQRARYRHDSLLVTAGAVLWIGVVALVARSTGQSTLLLVALGVVLPFLLWNGVMGFVVYLHHTSPRIAWFQDRHEWQRHRAYLSSTARVTLPLRLDRLMHGIMEHNAHHVNPRVSMFALRKAQRLLRERFPDLCDYRLDWRAYVGGVRSCKLYDYTNHAWLDFDGRVTARVSPAAPVTPASSAAPATAAA